MICLVMILRDEEAIIRETLEAVKPLIDRWCVVDTGSIDHTPLIVEDVLSDVPGRLVRAVWTDFGHARTRAFDEARSECEGAGWALIIDADSTVVHDGKDALTAELSAADSHDVEIRSGSHSHLMPCLLSLGHPWRWHGPVHEALIGEPYAVPGGRVGSLRIEPRSGGARSRDPEKYLRDADVLRRAAVNDPEWATRWTFYEANSWRDAGVDLEAAETYLARALLGGWDQERYISLLMAGDALRRLSAPLGEQIDAWLRGYEVDPTRPECLLRIAGALREAERYRAGWLVAREALAIVRAHEPHGLFVELDAWGWRPWFEVSVSAWWSGEMQAGIEASARVLADETAPDVVRERVQSNLSAYA